jgi:ferredoxin
MIITVQKSLPEILQSLGAFRKIFLVGCAACATKCQTGSEEAVLALKASLESAGKDVTGFAVLDTPCDLRIARKDLSRLPAALDADAVLVLACGAGVQAVEKNLERPVFPGLNPVFVGTTERIGVYREFCAVCGDCILAETGGICPVTRCAKGLVNGPCGGVVDGKCEVDGTRDCAWVLIYEKLKKTGREKELLSPRRPRASAKPRDVVTERKPSDRRGTP